MKIVEKRIDEIKPYEKNPRKNEKAIAKVAESIKQFGFKVPIVIDGNGVIVAGHTRWMASQELKLEVVPCVIADDLNEKQIRAFRIADNKVAEFSDWDFDLLKIEIEDLLDFDMGFTDKELDKLNDTLEHFEGEETFSEALEFESNYIVLKFDNRIDWLQAQTVLGIEPVKNLSTRKDGKITDKMKRVGTGRVLNGVDFINKLIGDLNEN